MLNDGDFREKGRVMALDDNILWETLTRLPTGREVTLKVSIILTDAK